MNLDTRAFLSLLALYLNSWYNKYMATTRIRKFYLKSKLNFGRYAGKTVAEVIAMGEGPYLRWCNQKMNKITFAKECDLKQFTVGHPTQHEEDDFLNDGAFGEGGYGDHE